MASKKGRPRRLNLTDEQLFTLSALAAKGATHAIAAAHLGISERGLRNVLERDQRARLAYDSGRAQLYTDLVGELVQRAMNPKAPQSTIALIFATKSLLGLRDQGEPPAPDDGAARLTLKMVLPRALQPERWRELVDSKRAELPRGDELEAEVVG